MGINLEQYFSYGYGINWNDAYWLPLNYVYKDFLRDALDEEAVVSDLVEAGVADTTAREFVEFAYFSVGRVSG